MILPAASRRAVSSKQRNRTHGNRNTDAISSGIGKEAGDAFQDLFYYGKTFGIYNTFLISMVIFVIFFFILSKTRTGCHIYAIGSNVDAAKLSGVSVFGTTTKTYLVSAFCAFVTGLILCAQAGMGNMEAGNTYEMYAVAASVIGGVSPWAAPACCWAPWAARRCGRRWRTA